VNATTYKAILNETLNLTRPEFQPSDADVTLVADILDDVTGLDVAFTTEVIDYNKTILTHV